MKSKQPSQEQNKEDLKEIAVNAAKVRPGKTKVYHIRGVTLTPGGYCGPATGVEVDSATAELWLKDSPQTWSAEPWEGKEVKGRKIVDRRKSK